MAAIAGRVMPITKGQYNSETTYEPLDFVSYNNALWGCIKPVKGIAPTEGQYWKKLIDGVVSDAASLGGETATQWQTKIDNIQTTSKATLSQAGWYRVAEYESTTIELLKGSSGNSCDLRVKSLLQSRGQNNLHLIFNALYEQPIFQLANSRTRNAQLITKIRHTYSSTEGKSWLEVYYSVDVSNMHIFSIDSGMDVYMKAWKAITPTLTSETVSGVTVTTTYDIPANASPVTNLDLKVVAEQTNHKAELLNTSILEKAVSLPTTGMGVYEYALGGGDYTGNDLPNNNYAYGNATVYVRYGFKTLVLWGVEGFPIAYNSYSTSGGKWKGWRTNFTDAGGEINGDVRQTITTASTISRVLQNQKKKIHEYISSDGTYVLADATNGKNIAVNAPDGANTWNGVASGCLPLDGGGTVEGIVTVRNDNWIPFRVINTSSDVAYIQLQGQSGVLGYLGAENGKPRFVTADGKTSYRILHEGNYEDYNTFSKGISLTNANADEGGEIRFASPVTDHSFGGMITQDIWRNMMRIFATHDGKTKLFNIDFASMKEGGNEALHTGNSAKVSISATAPSDTAALWVDTANKKVKAYIDGAWTAMA